jgi:hypothetical protein
MKVSKKKEIYYRVLNALKQILKELNVIKTKGI